MASHRLRKCRAYLNLLLSQDKVQGEALLVTANHDQVDCITEVIRNILRLPVGKKTKRLIDDYHKLLHSLADFAVSQKRRLQLIHAHSQKILEVLHSVKTRLTAVLHP